MAPTKTIPIHSELIRARRGIYFKLELQANQRNSLLSTNATCPSSSTSMDNDNGNGTGNKESVSIHAMAMAMAVDKDKESSWTTEGEMAPFPLASRSDEKIENVEKGNDSLAVGGGKDAKGVSSLENNLLMDDFPSSSAAAVAKTSSTLTTSTNSTIATTTSSNKSLLSSATTVPHALLADAEVASNVDMEINENDIDDLLASTSPTTTQATVAGKYQKLLMTKAGGKGKGKGRGVVPTASSSLDEDDILLSSSSLDTDSITAATITTTTASKVMPLISKEKESERERTTSTITNTSSSSLMLMEGEEEEEEEEEELEEEEEEDEESELSPISSTLPISADNTTTTPPSSSSGLGLREGGVGGKALLTSPTRSITSTISTTSNSSSQNQNRDMGGYKLAVTVHKVTSSSLLQRFHHSLANASHNVGEDALEEEGSHLHHHNGPLFLPSALGVVDSHPPTSPNTAATTHATKKRKITQSTSQPGECIWCGTRKTAQWRKGPTGPRGLCNRCGIEWAKQIRFLSKQSHLALPEAEVILCGNYKTSERFLRFQREHLVEMRKESRNYRGGAGIGEEEEEVLR